MIMFNFIQKLLKVFLDISFSKKDDDWLFIENRIPVLSELHQQISNGKQVVICFDRFRIFQYWLTLGKFFVCKQHFFIKSIYLINDDHLLKFIYASDSKSYLALRKLVNSAQLFLNRKHTLSIFYDNLMSFIPLMLRASQFYIYVTTKNAVTPELPPEIANLNHMFFSSLDKKLLMASYETLISGNGQIFKTTANSAYDEVMEKEFEITSIVSKLCNHSYLLPNIGGKININGRTFYHEEYVAGNTLTKLLRCPTTYKDPVAMCACLDQLDNWYKEYRTNFSGSKQSFECLYAPMFADFFQFFSADPEQCSLAEKVKKILLKLQSSHSGLISVIAHNDLWPANILVTDKGFVAIDWERATANKSELFDYFWMIISATLEYLSAPKGFDDFSRWFKCLLTSNDSVCIYARKKLEVHLHLNDISSEYMNLFIALFLMEFAVRGGLSQNSTGKIDLLAAEEFRCLVKQNSCFNVVTV